MNTGLFIDQNGDIDIELTATGFSEDNTLETAVLISIFSNQRCAEEEKISDSRQGWWGDLFSDFEGDRLGSKLYLLDRAKATEGLSDRAATYIQKALAWMIEDNVANEVRAEATFKDQTLLINVEIDRYDGKNQKYAVRWNAQGLARL